MSRANVKVENLDSQLIQKLIGITKYRFAEFGTMLEIRDCLALNNGCSIVTSIGVSRFKASSMSEKDGYDVAQVEVLKDDPIPHERLEGNLTQPKIVCKFTKAII